MKPTTLLVRVLKASPRLANLLAHLVERRPKGRAARFLAANDLLPDLITVEVGGNAFSMHTRNPTCLIARSIWLNGPLSYEPPLPELMVNLVRDTAGDVVVVGANTGFYALLAAATGIKVVAYEPSRSVLARLRANIKASGLEEQITVRPVAVADTAGTATLYEPKLALANTLDSSASLDATFKREHSGSYTVPVVRLDDDLERPIGILLVDAEGLEYAVLNGARRTLAESRPIVIVEVTDHDAHLIEEFAQAQHYRIHEWRSGELVPIEHIVAPAGAALVNHSDTRSNYWITFLLPNDMRPVKHHQIAGDRSDPQR